jgi:hypothetical protein
LVVGDILVFWFIEISNVFSFDTFDIFRRIAVRIPLHVHRRHPAFLS